MVVGGVSFGPSQRWLVMFVGSAVLVLFWCAGAVISNALWFAVLLVVHGILHQPGEDEGGAYSAELGVGGPSIAVEQV